MMSRLLHIPDSLARTLDAVFGSGTLQPTECVAKVLNICGKTLRRAGDEGKIAFSLKGTAHRLHTREAVEAYYLGDHEWVHINRKGRTDGPSRLSSTMTSSLG